MQYFVRHTKHKIQVTVDLTSKCKSIKVQNSKQTDALDGRIYRLNYTGRVSR